MIFKYQRLYEAQTITNGNVHNKPPLPKSLATSDITFFFFSVSLLIQCYQHIHSQGQSILAIRCVAHKHVVESSKHGFKYRKVSFGNEMHR